MSVQVQTVQICNKKYENIVNSSTCNRLKAIYILFTT